MCLVNLSLGFTIMPSGSRRLGNTRDDYTLSLGLIEHMCSLMFFQETVSMINLLCEVIMILFIYVPWRLTHHMTFLPWDNIYPFHADKVQVHYYHDTI